MPEKPQNDLRQEVALFRFRLLGELVHLEPGSAELAEGLREIAARRHRIPGSRRRRIAVGTLRTWLRSYRRNGFEGLHPKRRADRRQSRSLPPEVAELLVRIKEGQPRLTVKAVIRQAQDSGQVPQGVRLAHSTVNRLLKQAGLMDRPRAEGRDRRRYQWSLANELWQADIMYGPKIVRTPGRRKARAYLAAILDDATRVLPHAAFTFSEGTEHFLPVLRQAVLRRGIPLRLYCDNGATFRSKHLQVVCAQLGASLIHSRPYQPQGRGKIERFFRRVRADFLSELELTDDTRLEDLNRHLAVWLEEDYHHVPHHGLDGETPLDRWAQVSQQVRFAGPELDLQLMFCIRFPRRVSLARTVSLHGRTYETDASLIGESIVLLQDPGAPPSRPMAVLHRNRRAGFATLLDLHANARVRRQGPSGGDPPDDPPAPHADNQEPDADSGADPDAPRPEPLALRTLDSED